MKTIERRIDYNASTPPTHIEGLGDFHLGAVCCSIRSLKKVIAEIKANPNAYWIGMGDYYDAITAVDPRHKTSGISPALAGRDDHIELQYQMGVELLQPIAGQCLGMLEGNHEETLTKRAGINLASRLAHELKVPYLGYEGFVRLRYTHKSGGRGKTVDIFATHGHGGGRKPGSKINRVSDIFGAYEADFVFMAHTHEMLTYPTLRLEPDKASGVRHRHRVGQVTASYLLKHSPAEINSTTYVEKAGYNPVAIGRNYVRYNPNTGRKEWCGWVDDD